MGDSVKINAGTKANYKFTSWSLSNPLYEQIVSSLPQFAFTMGTFGDVTFNANWNPQIEFWIANDRTGAKTSKIYYPGQTVTLAPGSTPAGSMGFAKWGDYKIPKNDKWYDEFIQVLERNMMNTNWSFVIPTYITEPESIGVVTYWD